ncbi:hypothetical protein [Dyella sp. 20L07]|uniref:hypothetical protein n=1 Tax=Dyella sp. 20L07 TaxID=3384240 RepID=UPI003D2CF156
MQRLVALAVFAAAMTLGGCHDMTQPTTMPVHGFVTDTKGFDAFIATRPTPEQFRASYPDVQLVMPGTITTMDFRSNNSRYFVELDKVGHIVGGHFG